MDNAEWDLITNIRDELRTIAERIEELSDRLDEVASDATHGARAVDLRCRALTKQGKGPQCSRNATGRGLLAGYCKTHKPQIQKTYRNDVYQGQEVVSPPSVIRV